MKRSYWLMFRVMCRKFLTFCAAGNAIISTKLSKLSMSLIFLMSLLACGQTGPLYLPDQKPPIHVEPEAEPKLAPEPEPVNEQQEK